jgi:uncharacterized protein (TIGR02453 family)
MYFTEESLWFLNGLTLNNEKTWFDQHRDLYEKEVKDRFTIFLTELIEEVRKFDMVADLPLHKFRFRINKDVRFSKDKSPYNPWVSAVIGPNAKNTEGPIYYVRIGIEGLQISGGMYRPTSKQLKKIRKGIVEDGASLHGLLKGTQFKKYFDGTVGSAEKYKVLPKEYKKAAQSEPMLLNKGFTYTKTYPQDDALRDDLVDFVATHFKAAAEINHWIAEQLAE